MKEGTVPSLTEANQSEGGYRPRLHIENFEETPVIISLTEILNSCIVLL